MIPKSLSKIGKAAKSYDIPAERKALEGDDWLPPELGKFTPWTSVEASAEGEAVEEVESEDDEVETPRAASDVRTIADLVTQLRQVTAHLSAAEGGRAPAQQSAGSWLSRFFGSSSAQAGPAIGGDQKLASRAGEAFGLGAIGGAAGAAAFFGLALLYGKRATRS